MEEKKLAAGDSFEVTIPDRGAIGLQLLHEAKPAGIVDVEQIDSTGADKSRVGDPVNAVFRVKGLSPGDCTLIFFGTQPWIEHGPRYTQLELHIHVLPA